MKLGRRRYRLGLRAATAEATGARILDAAQALFSERPYDELTLEATASRAGVTLQTVLRRFGSKAGLIAAAAEAATAQVGAQRALAPVGDVRAAVKNLFDHYEEWGEVSLKLLAQESRFDEVARLARRGRALHAAWVERVFAPTISRCRGRARARRRNQLIAVCDVYLWKLLRRDLRQSRAESELAVVGLIEALVAQGAV